MTAARLAAGGGSKERGRLMALPWPSPWDVIAGGAVWLQLLPTIWPLLLLLLAFVILRILVARQQRRRYRGRRYLVVELDEE